MIQGSEEWKAARCGKVTASRVSDVMASGRGGAPSASRATYMGQLAAERLSGIPSADYKSGAMEWGTETEPQARANYTLMTGFEVEEVGSILHPFIRDFSASPDGLVGDDGLVEFKCPNSSTHIKALMGGNIDRGYMLQMQVQMACTGRKWCDFVSFDPRFPPEMQLHRRRVERDPAMIAEIEAAVMEFILELEKTVTELRSRFMQVAA